MFPDKDNPEWTSEDFKKARPASELPEGVRKAFRGPQKAPRKVPISIRLSSEVIKYYRAKGPGWQAAIDEDLKAGIRSERERKRTR